jgi:pyrimidine operon attenuation protein/uracil phosphoribosyltransferase
MAESRIILDSSQFKLTIERLCHQLIEEYQDFEDTCIIGIQERGVQLSDRIVKQLKEINPKLTFAYGKIDITFYRDDYRRRETPLMASNTEMDFNVEDKEVVLIDDVLYSGRTIQAGLIALGHYGRPKRVELLNLVDRRFNRHLPIQPNYTGITIDAIDEAYVKVEWEEQDGKDQIILFPTKQS